MAPRPALRLVCPPARRGASSTRPATAARAELQRALGRLQRGASPLANLPRLQLALHSLGQAPGTEAVRVAVVGLGPAAAPVARTLLKTLLADPLVDEQAWERELDGHDGPWPLVVRVCAPADAQRPLVTEAAGAAALPELHVSSPALNGLRLEMLLVNAQAPGPAHGGAALPQLQEAVLAPAVAMPSTVAPAATPVHQALIVAHGLLGAAHVASLPLAGAGAAIRAAVHLPGASTAAPGMDTVDVEQADQAIRLFRQSPQHAMQYERLWSASRVPAVLAWLKAAATPSTGDATKPAVRHLVASLLQATRASVDEAAARHPRCLPAPAADNIDLRHGLAQWAQRAHAELQDQLDLAFGGRRWRKLGWWKLFWRVDDVALLTNDMLSQYFLPTAEKHLVHLAGRIQQSMRGRLPRYPQPVSSRGSETSSPKAEEPETIGPRVAAFDAMRPSSSSLLPKWPGHIAFTRQYLQHETIPALQSLAQTLLAHVLTTSGLSTSLAALLYLSSWASTLYEAGAVAALGVVYGLGRLQRKWGTARNFWEAEVREEGRKALKSAEESVKTVLQVSEEDGTSGLTKEELHKARELVAQATDALARLE